MSKPSLPLDARGIAVLSVSVEFYSDANIWEYLRRLGVELKQKGSQWAAHLYGLPQDNRQHYLHVWIHTDPNQDAAAKVHWVLSLLLMPKDAPPEEIAASSALFGGYPEILTKLATAVPEEVKATTGQFQATAAYLLPNENWQGKFAYRSLVRELPHGSENLHLVREVWEASSEGAILNSVAIDRLDDGVLATATINGEWALSRDLMDKAEESIWVELQSFLTHSKR